VKVNLWIIESFRAIKLAVASLRFVVGSTQLERGFSGKITQTMRFALKKVSINDRKLYISTMVRHEVPRKAFSPLEFLQNMK
jgi:hypothetical protein